MTCECLPAGRRHISLDRAGRSGENRYELGGMCSGNGVRFTKALTASSRP